MPYGQFTDADRTDLASILDAVESIAQATPEVVWTGHTKRRFPLLTELMNAGGFPYLVAYRPQYASRRQAAGEGGRAVEQWRFVVYGIYSYLDPTDDLTFTTPEDTLSRLTQRFRIYYTLNRTCVVSTVEDQGYTDLAVADAPISATNPGELFMGVYVTLLVTVHLNINNTQSP